MEVHVVADGENGIVVDPAECKRLNVRYFVVVQIERRQIPQGGKDTGGNPGQMIPGEVEADRVDGKGRQSLQLLTIARNLQGKGGNDPIIKIRKKKNKKKQDEKNKISFGRRLNVCFGQ